MNCTYKEVVPSFPLHYRCRFDTAFAGRAKPAPKAFLADRGKDFGGTALHISL